MTAVISLSGKASMLTFQTGPPHTDDEGDDDLCISSQQLDLESGQKYKAPFLKSRSHCHLSHWKCGMAVCGCCIPKQRMKTVFKALPATDHSCSSHYHSHHKLLALPLLPTNNPFLLMEVKCDC